MAQSLAKASNVELPATQTNTAQNDSFAKGDQTAFERLVAGHAEYVSRLAYRLTGWDNEAAEDITQDVFLAAWKNRRKFRGHSSLKTWITTITVNKCHNYRRRRLLWRRFLSARQHIAQDNSPQNAVPEDDHQQLRAAVRKLSPKLREIIVLRYLEEMEIPKIAQVLDISINAVNLRLNRARKQLKQMLQPISRE